MRSQLGSNTSILQNGTLAWLSQHQQLPQQRNTHLDEMGRMTEATGFTMSVHGQSPHVTPLQTSCPSPKVKAQKGLFGQDRQLSGMRCAMRQQITSPLPYLPSIRLPFPSIFMGSALFEAKNLSFFPWVSITLQSWAPSCLTQILLLLPFTFFFFPLFFLLTRDSPLGFFSKQSHQAVTSGAP